MRRHERPQIPNVPWVSHSNLHKSENFFTKLVPPLDPSTSDLQNLGKSTPKVQPRAPKRSHDLSNDPQPSPLNLCKSAHDFGKLTIPWSSTALDQQNPKKFETKKFVTRWCPPPSSYHALPRSTRYTCTRALLRYNVMNEVILHYPGWSRPTWKSVPVQTACERKKIKINK